MVMPWGNYDGGELVIEEIGLVIDLPPGSIAVFPSWLLAHYNLHFTASRGSIVMHSDKQGKCWVDDRNGWEEHVV
jgi:predicted 2-oxoglutarate/Fe(II)-dependent dioxygenase YbiX